VKPRQEPLVEKFTPNAFNVPEPEQSPPDGLLATIEFLMFTVPLSLRMPPPNEAALLFDSVLLLTFTVPLLLKMPPPLSPAELPENVLLVIVTVPPPLTATPGGELFDWVVLVTVNVPLLRMPLPFAPLAFPLPIARSEIITVTPLAISKTREASLPLTVMTLAPGPLIVRSSVIAGNCPVVSVIVPVRPT